MENKMNEYLWIQVAKNIRKNGFEDITKENITMYVDNKKLVFRFYTIEQWKETQPKASTAQQIMGKSLDGFKMPDAVFLFEGDKYCVKIIK